MANVYRGVGVQWGVGNSTVSAFGTMKLQTRDVTQTTDSEIIQDATGNAVAKVYFNQRDEATFEYVPTHATVNGDVVATSPTIGDYVTVVDAVATYAAGTNWLVDDVSFKSSNTAATRITVKLTAYPGITPP